MIEPKPVGDDDWLEGNRAVWDEWAAAHVTSSSGYDLDGAVAGRSELRAWELAEVGPVEGLELLHLQCHIGTDTLSWAMHGASVTGLDFSAVALHSPKTPSAPPSSTASKPAAPDPNIHQMVPSMRRLVRWSSV